MVPQDKPHTRPGAFRDPITGQYPPLAGADDAAAEAAAAAEQAATGEPAPEGSDAWTLEEWKAHARKWEERAKTPRDPKAEAELRRERKARAEAEAKLAERETADLSEQERALAKAREEAKAEGKAEVTAAVRARILKAETRALAAGKFANPELAVKLLDLNEDDTFDADGEVIPDVIEKAITDCLALYPNLAAMANGGRPAGDADAGKGAGAKSLDAQIREAEESGDVKESIRLKNQKLFAQAKN